MAGDIEKLGPECVEAGVVGEFDDLDVPLGSGRVDLHSNSE